MSVRSLSYAEPFFSVKYVQDEGEYPIGPKSIVLNLAAGDIGIRHEALGFFASTVLAGVVIRDARRCLVIENHERHADEEALFAAIKGTWTLVYEATGLDRHKGVMLWRSPKERLGDTEVNMCYAEGHPLNVGLHRTHWGERPFREVHTQILGFGKMQQCSEQDIETLFREDLMAPGCTHAPMYDADCVYPWHQYETITKAIFQANEMQIA
jgi:hypothetical protein